MFQHLVETRELLAEKTESPPQSWQLCCCPILKCNVFEGNHVEKEYSPLSSWVLPVVLRNKLTMEINKRKTIQIYLML